MDSLWPPPLSLRLMEVCSLVTFVAEPLSINYLICTNYYNNNKEVEVVSLMGSLQESLLAQL